MINQSSLTLSIRQLIALFFLFAPAYAFAQIESIPSTEACWRQTMKDYGTSEVSMAPILKRNIEAYRSLVEESLVHREIAIQVMNRLLEKEGKVSGDVPLSGRDLDLLNDGLVKHLALREKLYRVAYAQSCWHKPSKWTYKKLHMQPISELNQLKGTMLSLSASLILYDNYLLMSSLFEENSKLRRFLNTKDIAYDKSKNELDRMTLSYISSVKRGKVQHAIKFYEGRLEEASAEWMQDEDIAYLDSLIQQSYSYSMMKKSSILGGLGRHISFMSTLTSDDIVKLKGEGINLFSGFFGNVMGLVESRKGKLYNDIEALNHIKGQLRAGDILLEKTPFRLTDKLIPGHWGHAAIWIGSESELRALGIWNDPVIVPYQKQIKRGVAVVEALRSGVQMNSMQHFLNVDDVAILRSLSPNKATSIKHILLALKQLGKAYDFNFDVETTDKIVCSELVYTVYTDMDWPTEKALGRYTISPDNVAKKALNGRSLNLISFYHDGKEIDEHPLELMAELMGEDMYAANATRSTGSDPINSLRY